MNRSLHARRVFGLVIAVFALVATASVTAGPASALSPPTVTSLDPQVAPTAGNVPVRIYGTDLAGATSVTFGTVAATDFVVIDAGLITAIVPPAAGGAGPTTPSWTSP